jgi:hypothetical protein
MSSLLPKGIGVPDSNGVMCYIGDQVVSDRGDVFVVDEFRITDVDILFISYNPSYVKIVNYLNVTKKDEPDGWGM